MRSLFLLCCVVTSACGSSRTKALAGERFVFPTEGRIVDLTRFGRPDGLELDPAALRPTEVVGIAPSAGQCVAPLVVVDWLGQAEFDPDAPVSRAAIDEWERRHGPVPFRSVVALRTGWSTRRDRGGLYEARDPDGVAHFPGFSQAAAEYLVRERRVTALLTEAPALDSGEAEDESPVARIVGEAGCYAIVGAGSLQALPPTGCLAIVAPFPRPGDNRSEARVYAVAPRQARRPG